MAMAMLSVNGAAVPTPSEMKVSVFDVAPAQGRSASGHAVLDRRGTKRLLALKWAHMTGEALANLLEQVGHGGFFEAAYPDPLTGEIRAMTCYAGECMAGVLRMENGAPLWTNIEMTWTER